jgi:hypothetical protein
VIRFLMAALLLMLPASTATLAHHSFAMYALNERVVLKGTVTRFRWVNPHSVLSVEPEAQTGQDPTIWNVELSSPGNLTRTGWSRRSVNVGDQVEVTLQPLRSGDPGGACLSVTLVATGQVLECGAGDAIRAGERPNLP